MKRHFLKGLLCLVAVFSFSPVVLAETHPPQLQAGMTMYHKNKVFDEGKFYIGKNAGRLDMLKKAKQTQIFRFDADKIEIWMHQPKAIMEMKMQYNALVDYKPAGFSENCVGEEAVEGHPCQKCIVTGKFMGKNVKSTIWKAKDLKGMVIKNMDDEGNGTVISHVALGPQADSLFVAPADYKRMMLPGNLGDILKGMAK